MNAHYRDMECTQQRSGYRRTIRELAIPLAPGDVALVIACFPFTEAMWDQMMITLQAMKPGIVEESAPEPEFVQTGAFSSGDGGKDVAPSPARIGAPQPDLTTTTEAADA